MIALVQGNRRVFSFFFVPETYCKAYKQERKISKLNKTFSSKDGFSIFNN